VTPWTGPNGSDKGRVLNFTGPAGRTWWLLASLQVQEGAVGRLLNMHDVAGDTYWGGVSPWAIDFSGLSYKTSGGTTGLMLTVEDEQNEGRLGSHSIVPASQFSYGTRYDLVIKVVFGRKDAEPSTRGATTIWVNGSDTPAVDLRNINTVYENQHWLQFWEGAYVPSSNRLTGVGKVQLAATRFGRTLAEALKDGTGTQPIADLGIVGCEGAYRRGSGLADFGDSDTRQLSSWDTASFRLSQSLGGSGSAAPASAPAPSPAPQGSTAAPQTNGSASSQSAPRKGSQQQQPAQGGGSAAVKPDPALPATEVKTPEPESQQAKDVARELQKTIGGVVWDGRLFRSADELRRHLLTRSVSWTSFVANHPAVIRAYDLPFVTWAGKRFYTQKALQDSLAAAGVSYRAWAGAHPEAWRILAGLPAAKDAPRIIASVQTGPGRVVWDGEVFTDAAVLRVHLKRQGMGWQGFLATHETIVEALSIPSLEWGGKTFYTRTALKNWLQKRGNTLAAWSAKHKHVADLLMP